MGHFKEQATEQMELFRLPPVVKGQTIQERFLSFHALNPWVYDDLVTLAREAKYDKGYQRGSIDALSQVLRWQRHRPTTGEKWKLYDHYRSRYARLIMEQEPDLEGFFELRELTTA